MEDLPQELMVESFSINLEFLENKTREVTVRVYLISISEIVIGIHQIGAVALLLSVIIF